MITSDMIASACLMPWIVTWARQGVGRRRLSL